jgi:MFS transporter, DHA1 family, inner membrane transport protein
MLLLVLSFCGLASAMSGRIVDPVVTEIAKDLDVPVGIVALLSTAYTLPFALSQPFLGPLGDLFPKARIVKIAIVLLALFLSFAALAPALPFLFVARVLAGIAGAAILPIGFALIGDAFPMSIRQVAISRFLAATLVGQIIGATLSGLLSHSLGWRVVFWSAAALTAAIALGALWRLPENRPANRGAVGLATAIANYRGVFRNPRAWICFSAVFIEGAVIYGWLPFLGDFLQNLNLGGVREAGIIISGLALGGILYTTIVSLLLKFVDRRQMMALGGVITASGLFCLSFGAPWLMQWAFMGIAGFGFFMLHNPIQTEVSELAPEARASAFSLHSLSFYTGQALGPVLYAGGAHFMGLPACLMFGAGAFVITGFGAWWLLSTR